MQLTMVTLSDGREVKLGRLRWGGYKKLKGQLIATMTGPVGEAIRRLTDTAEPQTGAIDLTKAKSRWAEYVLAALPDVLPTLAAELNRAIDESVPDLIYSSVVGSPPNLDDLSVGDVLALRDAVFAATDFNELLGSEKNFWLGMARKTFPKLFGKSMPSPFPGGSAGNP